jgi:hypothetical protein
VLRGFVKGLRNRQPVKNPELSSFYRQNFVSFASPWWFSRTVSELIREASRTAAGTAGNGTRSESANRWDLYFQERAHLYPNEPETLEFAPPEV